MASLRTNNFFSLDEHPPITQKWLSGKVCCCSKYINNTINFVTKVCFFYQSPQEPNNQNNENPMPTPPTQPLLDRSYSTENTIDRFEVFTTPTVEISYSSLLVP